MATPITQEYLRSVLNYDPATGNWTWLVDRSLVIRAGAAAGRLPGRLGYRHIYIDGRRKPAHRLAWLWMYGEWPREDIDHINCDKADNRFCNLREATRSQNLANSRLAAINTSGAKGVSWDRVRNRWGAHIRINGKSKKLGRFATKAEAIKAYSEAARKAFGEFARIE